MDNGDRMDSLIAQAADERQALARALSEVERLRRRERAARYRSLRIHAWMGILIGTAMLFTGVPQIFENQIGTWMRPFLGTLALVAGAILLTGIDAQGTHRKHLVEMVGLSLMSTWYGLMVLALLWSTYRYGSIEFGLPWDLGAIDLLQPRPYGSIVYLGLMCNVAFVHLPACWRDLHNRVDARDPLARG